MDPESGYESGTATSSPKGRVTRVLLNLSRGGADATYLREFDLVTESFVDADGNDMGFVLPDPAQWAPITATISPLRRRCTPHPTQGGCQLSHADDGAMAHFDTVRAHRTGCG